MRRCFQVFALFIAPLLFPSTVPAGTPTDVPPPTFSSSIPNTPNVELLDNYQNGTIACDWYPSPFSMYGRGEEWDSPTRISFGGSRFVKVNYRPTIDSLIRLSAIRVHRSIEPDSVIDEWSSRADSMAEIQVALMEIDGRASHGEIEQVLADRHMRSASLRELLFFVRQHPRVLARHRILLTLGHCHWPPGIRPLGFGGEGCFPRIECRWGYYSLCFTSERCEPFRRSLMFPTESSCRFLVVRTP